MNYNARDDKNDSRAIRDAEIDEGRNQEKSIKCWWLTRPLVQEKRKGKERELQVEWQASCHSREEAQSWTKAWNWVLLLQRKWSLEAEIPEYLVNKKDGKVNKGIFDIQVIDVYLTSVYSNPWVFDTCLVAKISNSK